MLNWLSRLVGQNPAPAVPPRPAPAPAAPPGSDVPAANSAPLMRFGVRRPLVGKSGAVAAFELRLPGALEQRLTLQGPGSDSPASAAHHAALLSTARLTLQQAKRPVLVSLPGSLLARPALAQGAACPGLMLLPLGAPARAEVVQDLRHRGALVGVPDGPPQTSPPADFVLLHAPAGGIDTLLLSAQRWHEQRPGLRLVALGLESVDDVERVLRAGVALAGGRLEGQSAPAAARPLQAAAHRICALLNELAMDRDTGVIADAVRADVALSYRLLRYANSPAIGASRSVETVETAVMLLGRAELGRWLSVMLLSAAGGRQVSAALQEGALARGRLLELLARQQGVPRPEVLFTVGLLSRLHLLLQMPLATALEPLRLSGDARLALLERQGPWAPYLALADEIEGDDEAHFGVLCQPHGGIDAVLSLAETAWGWATEVAGSQQQNGPAK